MTKVLMVGHGAFAEKHMDGIKNIPGVEVVSTLCFNPSTVSPTSSGRLRTRIMAGMTAKTATTTADKLALLKEIRGFETVKRQSLRALNLDLDRRMLESIFFDDRE